MYIKCITYNVGWLLPLLSNLSDPQQYRDLPTGHAPICVVICPGVKTANSVYDEVKGISSMSGLGINCLLSCYGITDNIVEFINGVDILVTTPARLLKLLCEDRIMTLARCCHLVIEDGDTMVSMWGKELSEIMTLWKKSKIKKTGMLDQVIIVAEKYSNQLENFTKAYLKPTTRPVIAFANLLEAAIYGKIDLIPTVLDEDGNEKKKDILKQLVTTGIRVSKRTIICCNSKSASILIHRTVSEMGIKGILLNSDSDITELDQLMSAWNQNPTYPLIVSDDSLQSISFTGLDRAAQLIHWDIPSNKSTFSARRGSSH